MQAVWIKNAIALCLIVESCNGNHFKGPINTTVPEGTRVTLSCQTSSSKTVWWKYQQHDVFYANTIAHAYKSSHEAYVDASKGIYNLIILNASSHAGLYTCVDDDGEGESRSVWLTVTATETSPTPPAENNTVAIAVVSVCLVIIIIVIVIALVLFCKRHPECCQHKASEDNLKPTVENDEAAPLTGGPSEGKNNDILNEDTREHTPETQEDRREDVTVSTETRQNSTTTGVKEIEEPTTSSYVERNSQAVSSVSSTQEDTLKKSIDGTSNPSEKDQAILEISQRKTGGRAMEDKPIERGPVAKPSKPNKPETPLASTTPEEKQASGNDNVNTTEPKSTSESTNTTDNTQTDPLKPDGRPKVRPTPPPKPTNRPATKPGVSAAELGENSQKNERMQDSVENKKPDILSPKPKTTSVSTNEGTESTTKNGGHILPIVRDDSNPEQHKDCIAQPGGVVDTEEVPRDLPEQSVTGGDDKKEISFKK